MILLRQAVRSMWRSRKSYLACIVLMAVGIALYVAFHQLLASLTAAAGDMYREQRFGDGFVRVRAIPASEVARLGETEGIDRLDASIVTDARVRMPDSFRIITLRLNSYVEGNGERLNDFALVEGDLPGRDGLLVSSVFAQANNLAVGDSLELIVGRSEIHPVITGTVRSPEYVYAVPDTGQTLADDGAFGFGYISAQWLGELTGLSDFATNLSFRLEPGTTFTELKPYLEDFLAPYGLTMLTDRDDHPSNAMLTRELEGIASMASSLPLVFILMVVIILYIMLRRIIEQERVQIGTLKALGFSSGVILVHYLGYGLVAGLTGGVCGLGLARVMADALTRMYLGMYNLPAVEAPMEASLLLTGLAIAAGAGVLGAGMGARSVVRLSPSEAMRASAPPAARRDLLGGLPFLGWVLASHGIMAVRNISRNKFRSAFVVLGIAFSFTLIAYMTSYGDMFEEMLLKQFTQVELYNLKITLVDPSARTPALEAAEALPEVRHAETMLELPVELRLSNRKKSVNLTALEPEGELYHIYDSDTEETLPPPWGCVILSSPVARALGAVEGDVLLMTTPYTGDEEIPLPVSRVISSNLGVTAFIQMDSLWELLGIPPTVNSLLMRAEDPDRVKDLLLEAENVLSVTDQDEAKAVYTGLLATYSTLIAVLRLAGIGIAFAIITNTASISLSERKREYATMRVLGMSPREICRIIGFEYWVLTLWAIPPGMWLTRLVKEAVAGSIENDTFSMPVDTHPSSFITAGVLCLLTVLLSNWFARRKIAHFDMVEVLKERE